MNESANHKIHLERVLSATLKALAGMGAGWDNEIGLFRRLKERLGESKLHLAVLGQFKRGKSTLLNALLGESLLPSAVVPLTAIPTLIEYGEMRRVHLIHRDGKHQDSLFET